MTQSLQTWVAALIGPLLDALSTKNTIMIGGVLLLLTALFIGALLKELQHKTKQEITVLKKKLAVVSLAPLSLMTLFAVVQDANYNANLSRVVQENTRLSNTIAEIRSIIGDISSKLSKCEMDRNEKSPSPNVSSKPLFLPDEFWLRDKETKVSLNSQILVTYRHNYADDSGKLIVYTGDQKESISFKNSGERFVFSFAQVEYFISVVDKDAFEKRVKLKIHRNSDVGWSSVQNNLFQTPNRP
ncbi:MAG: hypothetical protein MI892_08175 [Desulfobacterales bacterium]|nr:hypothetical protein [Desulfobacterales bacterium]